MAVEGSLGGGGRIDILNATIVSDDDGDLCRADAADGRAETPAAVRDGLGESRRLNAVGGGRSDFVNIKIGSPWTAGRACNS